MAALKLSDYGIFKKLDLNTLIDETIIRYCVLSETEQFLYFKGYTKEGFDIRALYINKELIHVDRLKRKERTEIVHKLIKGKFFKKSQVAQMLGISDSNIQADLKAHLE